MVGITRIGAYFPRRRLDRALIAKAWGTRVPAGTRTVAGLDEDALTMATDALLACLGDADPAAFDALYFASTSSPYLEKQVASMIATAADLRRDIVVADLAGSVRAGLAALRAALDGVRAGSLRTALVAAADARLGEPESELEPLLGDGAASVAVGSEGVVAELVSTASVAEEFTYAWTTDGQRTLHVSETRFGTSHGYVRDVAEVIGAALRKAELPPARVARLVLGAPEPRAAAEAARRAGLDPARQLEASLLAEAGLLGTPEPLALLARALETAAPGDFLVVGAYGEGADALVLRATERLPAARPRPLADRLAHGIALPSYERYLRARGVLPSEPMGEPVTAMIEWKELKQDMRLYGSRCEACGLVQYPQARVCIGCQARDRMQDHKLGKRGSVFTCTIDNLAPVPEHPMPMAVIDLDGGGRVYLQVTDAAEGEVKVGAPVELTFRRLHEVRRSLRAELRGAHLRRRLRGLRRRGHRAGRDRGRLPGHVSPRPRRGEGGGLARRRAAPLRPPHHARRELLRDGDGRLPQRLPRGRGRRARRRPRARRREAEGPRRPWHPAPGASAARARQHRARSLRARRQPLHAHLRPRARDARQGRGQEPSQRGAQRKGAPAHRGDRGAGAEGADHRLAVRSARLLPHDRRGGRGDHLPRRPGQALQEAAGAGQGRGPRRRDRPSLLRSHLRLPRLPLHAGRRAPGVRGGRDHGRGHRLRRGARLLHVDRDLEHRGPGLLQEGRGREAGRGGPHGARG